MERSWGQLMWHRRWIEWVCRYDFRASINAGCSTVGFAMSAAKKCGKFQELLDPRVSFSRGYERKTVIIKTTMKKTVWIAWLWFSYCSREHCSRRVFFRCIAAITLCNHNHFRAVEVQFFGLKCFHFSLFSCTNFPSIKITRLYRSTIIISSTLATYNANCCFLLFCFCTIFNLPPYSGCLDLMYLVWFVHNIPYAFIVRWLLRSPPAPPQGLIQFNIIA